VHVDWQIVVDVTIPIITLFLGVWAQRWMERRAALVSYFGHVSSFTWTPPKGTLVIINTHTVVLRNAGKRSATNVRVHHFMLPDYNMWPSVQHHREDLPDGSVDLVFPVLVPGEEVVLSYLYFPPTTATQVSGTIKSDEGFATTIPVLLQRMYPKWFNVLAATVLLCGLIAVGYLVVVLVRLLVSLA